MAQTDSTPPFDVLFKDMNEISRQIWRSWRAPSGSQPYGDVGRVFDRSFMDSLEVSERLVQDTIRTEKELIDQWCTSVTRADGQGSEVRAATEQWRETMDGWLNMRARLWEQWFREMRRLEEEARPLLFPGGEDRPGTGEPSSPEGGGSGSEPKS